MQLPWPQLRNASPGQWVEVEGWLAPLDMPTAAYGLLTPQPDCCLGCPPSPANTLEIHANTALPATGRQVRLAGRFHPLPAEDPTGWRWQLTEARPLAPPPSGRPAWLSRRAALSGLPLACLGVAASGCATPPEAPVQDQARALLARHAAMDLHSHAGRVIISRGGARPMQPIAEPMRAGGMRLIALAMVADSPLTQIVGGRIMAYREPRPGELAEHAEEAFDRVAAVIEREALHVVTDQASLRAMAGPAVLVAAEGADFLDGQPQRLQAAFERHRLRHLQLVHYRVNELGDIQTEAPVHNGLTPAGAAVVREANRLGVVVDVAHASLATVRGVAEAASKPFVLSHTSLNDNPPGRTRTIRTEHARLVAASGGVIGVWPPEFIFRSLRAYAEGIARMVEAAGVAHVGIGTDMLGLPGGATFGSYRQTGAVAAELLGIGFGEAEVAQLMGGNFARVLAQVLPG